MTTVAITNPTSPVAVAAAVPSRSLSGPSPSRDAVTLNLADDTIPVLVITVVRLVAVEVARDTSADSGFAARSGQAAAVRREIGKGVGLTLAAELKQSVERYLDERRLIGTKLEVRSPHFIWVSIEARIRLPERSDPALAAETRRRAEAELYRYLNAYVGGPTGTGWRG